MFNTSDDKQRLLSHFQQHSADDYFNKHYGARMMPIFVQAYVAVMCSTRQSPFAMTHGMFFQNFTMDREFDWLWKVTEMKEMRQRLFAALENDSEFGKKFFAGYLQAFEKFDTAAKHEEQIPYQTLSPEVLLRRMLALIEAASHQGHGYVVDSLLTTEGDDWFGEYAAKYLGRTLSDDELSTLREPTHRSFVNQYRLRLLEAACARENGENIESLVAKIVREYYWVENNYIKTDPKKREHILSEIDAMENSRGTFEREKKRIDMTIEHKEILYHALHAPSLLRAFVQFADDATTIQDHRKQVVLRLNHFLLLYLREIAKKIGFDEELIFYVMFFELEDFLKDPARFVDIAKERQKGCLALFDKDGCAIVTRQEIADAGIDVSHFFVVAFGITELRGAAASPGHAKGIARVILGSDQFARFHEGDILITNQTTPDFVPLMKRAGAVVAEQGGVTSHAAIVSRELGIPCIVGVKDAMRVFRDGENVEVDAVKGVVRKLK